MAARRLLLGTGNEGKVRELRRLLDGSGFRLVSVADLARPPEMPEETGTTYRENSRIKALGLADETGLPTLADDSGLEVACLDGRPGVFSSRYGPSDGARIDRLLEEIGRRVPAAAQFVCVASIALPDGRCRSFTGCCPGRIINERRGEGGFGFDPVFLLDGREVTMAQLPTEAKNRMSHRARAVRTAVRWLRSRRGRDWLGTS